MDDLARAAGFAFGSSLQRYESADYRKKYLPRDLVEKLAKPLVGRGNPPILAVELFRLAGLEVAGSPPAAPAVLPGRMTQLIELDVRAGAGASLVEAEHVASEWLVPRDLFAGHTTAPMGALRVISVQGDSMEPELMPGTRVVVDTEDTRPSPPGLFVVWDGLATVIKRVMFVPNSDPPTVRIMSDNPKYPAYERTADEVHIRGRVIGHWRWR